jgi:thiol:disulfide interchange protein
MGGTSMTPFSSNRILLPWTLSLTVAAWLLASPAHGQDIFQLGNSPAGGTAASGDPATVQAELLPGQGGTYQLRITADIADGWHTYSLTQPAGGPVATRIKLDPSGTYKLAGDWSVEPAPEKHPEPAFDNLMVESHAGRVVWTAPVAFAAGATPSAIQGSVSLQACTDQSCLPPKNYPFTAALSSAVAESTQQAASQPAADSATLTTSPPAELPTTTAPSEATSAAASTETPEQLFAGIQLQEFTATATSRSWILVMALAGGFILNFMPCVLPVIGLKILSFVEQSGHDRGRVFWLNLWYSLGILFVFMILASLAAFFSFGWGEQFTKPGFNIALAGLVFAMALSFLGVWEIPIPGFVGSSAANDLAMKEGVSGAFFKGIFTTILATPCSGPFLGPVFGFTLRQPSWMTFAIFGCVGLGMASPYLLIGLFPRLIRFLPKPGAWMDTFKQFLAFFLLGTVVFLFTFISTDYVIPTFAMLVGIWAACWWIGRTSLTANLDVKLRAWGIGAVVATAVGLFAFTYLVPGNHIIAWNSFSAPELKRLTTQGNTVLVDFTADWCLVCKTNEKLAIEVPEIATWIDSNRVVPMKADWTAPSDEIKGMLAVLGSNSIPILAIFPADRPHEPIILRDAITRGQLLAALRAAGPSQTTQTASNRSPRAER